MGRILIVDDDPDILKITDQVLTGVGHTVFVAEDALRAIDILNVADFDLLISDANMPHYSGFDLINTVKANVRFKDLTIAMLTGLRERKDVERALAAGVDDYIVKPLDPLLLIQKVDSLFSKNPPAQHPEISLAGSTLAQGTMYRPMQVESVSELGLKVISDVLLTVGMIVEMDSDFFKSIGSEPPPMKVLSVEKLSNGSVRAQLIFMGAREAFLQKIRRWLYSHGASQKNAA